VRIILLFSVFFSAGVANAQSFDFSVTLPGQKYEGKNTLKGESFYQMVRKQMAESADFLASLNPQTAASSRDPSCVRRYGDIFDKQRIDVRIVLGYQDSGATVLDPVIRLAFADQLVTPCSLSKPALFACGFRANPGDPDLFSKTIQDAAGLSHLVQITLVNSAITPNDEYNRRDPKQKERTEKAARTYFSGLRAADVVFYEGHSRNGGGPDFGPPQLRADGHTDYAWYRKHRDGRDALREALAAGTPAKVIGLFSCSSELHFLRTLQEGARKSTYFLSRSESWFQDTGFTTFAALNALLGQVCKPAIHQALKHPSMDKGSWMYLYNF
jgi:hypothetical protein